MSLSLSFEWNSLLHFLHCIHTSTSSIALMLHSFLDFIIGEGVYHALALCMTSTGTPHTHFHSFNEALFLYLEFWVASVKVSPNPLGLTAQQLNVSPLFSLISSWAASTSLRSFLYFIIVEGVSCSCSLCDHYRNTSTTFFPLWSIPMLHSSLDVICWRLLDFQGILHFNCSPLHPPFYTTCVIFFSIWNWSCWCWTSLHLSRRPTPTAVGSEVKWICT